MSADREVARRAETRHGIVRRRDALDSGLSRSTVRRRATSGRLVECRPRVFRVAGAPVTWRGELLATVDWAGEGALASHRSAAALWGLDGWPPEHLDVVVPVERAPRGQPRVSVRRVGEIHPRDRTTIDGIPTTGIALTLLHVAALVSRDRLATTLDSAIVQGLTRADRVLRCVDGYQRRGRRGVGNLVELLGDRLEGHRSHESRFERRLATLLVAAALPRPTAQFEVRDGGAVVARPDLAYPELRIAIEADSYRWHGGRSAWERDLRRRTELAAAGWLVLHFSWRDLVSRPTAVVARVRRTLDLRTSAPEDPTSGS